MAFKNHIYTVVVVDDHDIIRDALTERLKSSDEAAGTEYQLVGTAENGLEAIAAVKAHKPDLLILDISMPFASGTEIIHDLRRWSPETRIAVFTGVSSPGLLASVAASGVDGLFSKGVSTSQLFEKLPLILLGKRYIAPEFLSLIERGEKAATLTDRECQILNMIVAGKSNKEMAAVLNISPKTVDKHRTSLMAKLDVHSVAELMARALKDGLIDPT